MVSRGKSVFAKVQPKPLCNLDTLKTVEPNDIILHALFARLTLTDNRTIEFETKFDKKTQTVELNIAEKDLKFFDQILGMRQGPNFRTFIDWLIGSRRFDSKVTPDFVSASAFDIWYGATESNVDGTPVVLFPTVDPAHIGYNFKLRDNPDPERPKPPCPFGERLPTEEPIITEDIKVIMLWKYICGSKDFFELRVTATIINENAQPVDYVNDVRISTASLEPGDIAEVELISLTIPKGSVVGLSILRNFKDTEDPHSEMFGILGVRITNG